MLFFKKNRKKIWDSFYCSSVILFCQARLLSGLVTIFIPAAITQINVSQFGHLRQIDNDEKKIYTRFREEFYGYF